MVDEQFTLFFTSLIPQAINQHQELEGMMEII